MSGLEEASLAGFDETGSNLMKDEVEGRQQPLSFRFGLLAGGVGMILLLGIPCVALARGAGSASKAGLLNHSLIGLSATAKQAGLLTFSRKNGKKYCLGWQGQKVSLEKWPCIGQSQYYWTLESNGMIKPSGEDKCLDVGQEQHDDDWNMEADLSLQGCNPGKVQQFLLRGWDLKLKGSKRDCSYIQIDSKGKGEVKCYDHHGSDNNYRWAYEVVVDDWNQYQ